MSALFLTLLAVATAAPVGNTAARSVDAAVTRVTATRAEPHRIHKPVRRPRAPVPIPPPDINSEAYQRQLARERATALRRATRQATSVHRAFGVGWEMHYGFFLSVPGLLF